MGSLNICRMNELADESKAYIIPRQNVVLDRKKKRELRGAWKDKERLLGQGTLQGDPKGWVRCEQALKRPVGRSFIAQGKGGARRKVANWQERVRGHTWMSPGSGACSWMPVSRWLPSVQ